MPWILPAVIGGSAILGAVSSNNAANTQAAGQEQAAQTQLQMFNTITGQEQPYMQAGNAATTSLSNLLGTGQKGGADAATGLPTGYLTQTFNPTQQQLDQYPGYQFALQQGGQAVRNADTPTSGVLSGAALKDLTNFNVGTANQYYGQYFNQFQQQQNSIFSRLSAIAGLGQNAASNTGNNGAQLGTGIAQAQAAAAGSQAAGQVGVANAIGSSAVPLAYLLSGQGSSGGGTGTFNGISFPSGSGGSSPYSLTGSGD